MVHLAKHLTHYIFFMRNPEFTNVMFQPQRLKSDKSLPYSCVYCDRKFARPHEKVKHERIHTGMSYINLGFIL